MTLHFDFQHVTTVEFGVGRDDGSSETFSLVPVDSQIQEALREMAETTWNAIQESGNTPPMYDPSEKYTSTEPLYLPLSHQLAERMRHLYTAANLSIDGGALASPNEVFCYFARFTDSEGRRLTALKRATQFKGILKSRLLQFVSDALKLVEDKVFKLDLEFDLLIDEQTVHILRPSAFEFAGKLQGAILAAVATNIAAIKIQLKFVEYSNIQAYALSHPRAARYIASIRSQEEMKNIDKAALKRICKINGVPITESQGKIIVDDDAVMDFLEVLDRRRYQLELVKGSPERFKAASRSKLAT